MSRSRKKNPGYMDSNPWAKAYFNRKFRRTGPVIHKLDGYESMANGNAYRKFSCSYTICDYGWLMPKKDLNKPVQEWGHPTYRYVRK